MTLSLLQRFEGALLGLATGDAVGTTLEFKPRGSFSPIQDMVGGGPFDLKPGQWTDDTSMALCLATSLLARGGTDLNDQITRYCRWYQEGYLSSTGTCFDIGNTVTQALESFLKTGNPIAGSTHPRSAGNGSLMRLAPVIMYFYPDPQQILEGCKASSITTHGAPECIGACTLFGIYLFRAFEGKTKSEILSPNQHPKLITENIQAIARGDYQSKPADDIRGTGYVVQSLEAVLWCFIQTESYQDAVLAAANLGDDADTTAAIVGQIAGAYYGVTGIPQDWLSKLTQGDMIRQIAQDLYQAQTSESA